MRFMMMVRASKDSEAGVMPDDSLIAAMTKYNEEMAKAGILLDLAGLQPSSKGARIKFSGGKPTVVDGPFAETKELIAGYWLIQVKSKEEAIDWAKRCPSPHRRRSGRRDRASPIVRARGFRSKPGDRGRAKARERTGEEEVINREAAGAAGMIAGLSLRKRSPSAPPGCFAVLCIKLSARCLFSAAEIPGSGQCQICKNSGRHWLLLAVFFAVFS